MERWKRVGKNRNLIFSDEDESFKMMRFWMGYKDFLELRLGLKDIRY